MDRDSFWYSPVYRFVVASDRPFDGLQAVQLTTTLLSFYRLVFQIVARSDGIRWQVIDLSGRKSAMVVARSPEIEVRVEKLRWAKTLDGSKRIYPFFRGVLRYRAHSMPGIPILYATDLKGASDPIVGLAQVMNAVRGDEQIRYNVLVSRPHKPRIGTISGWISETLIREDFGPYSLSTSQQRIMEHKRLQPWYETCIEIEIDSPHPFRVNQLAQAIKAHLGNFDRTLPEHPYNGLILSDEAWWEIKSQNYSLGMSTLFRYEKVLSSRENNGLWLDDWSYFAAAELAALWHLPHKDFQGINILWKKPRPEVSHILTLHYEGTTLGKALYQNRQIPVSILDIDRATHLNIVGRTGVGKSTLLHRLVRQDIAAGKGVAVIDPHGKLVRDILRCSIPPERERDVVILDLACPDFPIPLNIFAGAQSYAAIGRVVDMVERMSAATGVRMDKYLRAGIRALQRVPDATMKDLYRLFTDELFRFKVLESLEDDELFQTLHNEYHILSDGKKNEIRSPILNRISPFYTNPYLYPILCHPQRIDLGELIERRKIILIALGVNSEVVPKQERDLVGSLFISLFQMAGMSTSRTPAPFYIYVDEVQNFVTTSLEVVFSEARKYGLSMTVAHQFFGQLSTETLQSIMGNVGATVAFRSNVDDARALAPYMQPSFDIPALVNLDKYQAAIKMQHQGETQAAFLLYADPPPKETANAVKRENYLRGLSAQQYTPMNREAVLTWLQNRYPLRQRSVTPPHSLLDTLDDFYESPDFVDGHE